MKAKAILLFIFVTALFSSCKNEKAVDNLEVVDSELLFSNFKVTLDVTVKEDDDFSIFYTVDGSTDFTKIPPMWQAVKGSQNNQKIVFTLPEDVIPTQLRIDFGINEKQEDIILNNVEMEYMGKSKKIGCPELVSYFRADDSKCTFDHLTGRIVAKIVEGKRQYPSLYPHETVLQPEIEKLIQ